MNNGTILDDLEFIVGRCELLNGVPQSEVDRRSRERRDEMEAKLEPKHESSY